MEILEEKAGQYVEKELITRAKADSILEIILGERGQGPEANPLGGADNEDGNATRGSRKLSLPEMATLLAKRERQMQEGGTDEHPTDQSDIPRGVALRTHKVPRAASFDKLCKCALKRMLATPGGGSTDTSCKG